MINAGNNMKTPLLTILFCLSAFAAGQNQPTATHVGPHVLGETFQQWLIVNQLDLAEICRPHKRGESKEMDFKAVCKALSGIQAIGSGQFYLGDASSKQAFKWVFMDGRLSVASTESADIAQQIKFLEQTYGAPAISETVPYQNSYGAKWDCLVAIWRMPDGAMIRAAESVNILPISGLSRQLTVTFFSKERADWLTQQEKKPNPYAQ
jgi:hypothetical protein